MDELTDTLKSHGYGAQALHGGLDQRQRDRVMQLFRSGKADVLVATDVAARGLDIDHVSHVINYDIPTAPEVYVHRIGRTGRIGREGVAITLVDPREQRTLRYIEGLIKQKIDIATLPTLSALKAKRLDATRGALTTRIAAGDLDDPRALVQALAADFDVVDIAAAAVALLHAAGETTAANAPDAEAPPPERAARPPRLIRRRGFAPATAAGRPGRRGATAALRGRLRTAPLASVEAGSRVWRQGVVGAKEKRPPRPAGPPGAGLEGGTVVLSFSVGRTSGVRPGDLVGAITGESGITSRELGVITILPHSSMVEVAEAAAGTVVKAMKGAAIRGEPFDVKIREAHALSRLPGGRPIAVRCATQSGAMELPLLVKAVVLGIIEGLTEFLPVSSTGHLILAGDLLGFNTPQGKVFEVVIQTGAMLAIVWEYRARFTTTLLELGSVGRSRRLVTNLLIAFMPAAILGLAFGKFITRHLFSPIPVATAFIVGGVVILWAERRTHVVRIADVDSLTALDAFKVGCAQCLALIPGTSRAGATIIGGLLFGLSRTAATEFSFFLAVPTLMSAGAYQLFKERDLLSASDTSWFAAGGVAAFVAAFFCVRWLIRFVSAHDFTAFAWYRIAFGIAVIVTAQTGLVHWTAP